LKALENYPTQHGFQPIPIHVGNIDSMMRGMDTDVCPFQAVLRHQFAGTDDWKKLNEAYQEILFTEMYSNFNILPNSLNFSSAYTYIDNYYSAWFDQMVIPKDLTDDARTLVNKILRDGLYEGYFGLDLAIRLATTRFFNFLHTTIERKISALEGADGTPDFYKHIKYMYLSAHDSSLSAFMSGLLQVQEEQVFFASDLLVEVYSNGNNSENVLDNYSVRMLYNQKPLNVGGNSTCPQYECSFSKIKEFLKSREYQGDYDLVCNPNDSPNSSAVHAWMIVLLVTAILIVLLIVAYFAVGKCVNKPSIRGEILIDQENPKMHLNKSDPVSTRVVTDNDSD
jgi:hypothetical protein